MSRVVCWWSAGAASTVAAKLAQEQYGDVVIAYCDTSSTEHPDNLRFLRDCEEWFGQRIVRLRSLKYADIWEVFARTGWLVGPAGARCTTELKKLVRREFEDLDDLQVFGFTSDEEKRAQRFQTNNPEIRVDFPLITKHYSKNKCLRALADAGIEIPEMYRLGYRNNNCLGCVKGGAGYWNKIRIDFPDVFSRMSKVERSMDVAINKTQRHGKRCRVFLDELHPDAGDYSAEPDFECGVACGSTQAVLDFGRGGQ